MAGAYAHLTLVNLAREPARLDAGPGMPPAAALALGRWFAWCELGALSPDYPYLALDDAARQWADLMHYEHTGDVVKNAIEFVRTLRGSTRDKAFAWLLGYAAHVITDATIHPVVELKVGPYAQNKTAHRICEMHQDAYIFQRMNLGEVGLSAYLESGIGRCSEPNGAIEASIGRTWRTALAHTYTDPFAANPPDLDRWHHCFHQMLETISELGNRLSPIARHVATGVGLSYPALAEVDRDEYIDRLATPHGPQSYDRVFDKALRHVVEGWHLVAEAVFANSDAYQTAFWGWNLDTGRDPDGRLVLWQENT